MEEDREATNLGPSPEDTMPEEPTVVPRQPKRRFVGRKAADKAAASQPTDPNASIEDSSAIQGVRAPSTHSSAELQNDKLTCIV